MLYLSLLQVLCSTLSISIKPYLTTDMALRLERSREQQRHQFDACQVDRFSKNALA